MGVAEKQIATTGGRGSFDGHDDQTRARSAGFYNRLIL